MYKTLSQKECAIKAQKMRGGNWLLGYMLTESCNVIWTVEEDGKSEENVQLILHTHPGISVGMDRYGAEMEVNSRLGTIL